jgi:hypothetical protein
VLAVGEFALFLRALGADADDGRPEGSELGEAVAVGTALRRAAAGAWNVVPAGRRRLAGLAGARVDVGDEEVAQPGKLDLPSAARRKRGRREWCAW